MSQHDDLKAELLKTDDEFRRLYEEHQEYDKRLQEINQKSLLSQEDEAEEKKIKLWTPEPGRPTEVVAGVEVRSDWWR